MTIREALQQKRVERKGTVKELVLCKGELFYQPSPSPCGPADTVYPVSQKIVAKEAKWFGVGWSEQ